VTMGRHRSRRRPRAAVVALVAAMTVGVAGCGIPVDRSPSALPRKGVPFGLLQPSARSTTTTSAPSPVEAPVHIYLITGDGHLIAVSREVPAAQESLTTVLEALVIGPTDTEATAGLETAVPTQTVVLAASVGAGGIATVNLGGTFGELVGQAQIQAVAQIVFTTASLPGTTGVAFELSGKSVDVPVASGALVPVASIAQFAPLAPQF
jgi:spore germination protein GerM